MIQGSPGIPAARAAPVMRFPTVRRCRRSCCTARAPREPATHNLALPPATTDCGQAILHACHQAGPTPTTHYVTADIAAQLTRARAGLAIALVPRTAIDPATPAIRTAPVEDHPILRLLYAATRHTQTENPTTTAVITAHHSTARSRAAPHCGDLRIRPGRRRT
ncbi:LysR family transcriptional regulator substrate-binding protein [Streptomyces scabiei]|uniref:LysR family transcriptional regulator substrate-binding protein n=1 Tax=Streptomyces scabiei TaxID=1930 RepID=UPI0038F6A03F